MLTDKIRGRINDSVFFIVVNVYIECQPVVLEKDNYSISMTPTVKTYYAYDKSRNQGASAVVGGGEAESEALITVSALRPKRK